MEKEFINPKIRSASNTLKKVTACKGNYGSNPKSSNCYALLRDSQTREKEVAHLTAQSRLVDKLLEKVSDDEQSTKLTKRKKDCLLEQVKLSKILSEIQIVQYMISRCCTPLFNFTTAFCENTASISCQTSKSRIDFLKELRSGESDLLDLITDMPLLSVLESLELKMYRPLLERYSEKFFSGFSLSDKKASYYNKCLLISRTLCVDFSGTCYLHFYADDFDLYAIKESLRKVFDTDKEAISAIEELLPHRLVALNLVFVCHILAEFLKLKPVASNFHYLRPFFERDEETVVDFEASKKINVLHRLFSLQKELKKLEAEIFLFQKRDRSLFKTDIRAAFAFYEQLQKKGNLIEEALSRLLGDDAYRQEVALLLTILKGESSNELRNIAFTKIGLAPFPENFNCENQIACIENNIKALRYFFHMVIFAYDKNKLVLSEGLKFFLAAFSLDELDIISLDFDKMVIEDFIDLSYFTFCSFLLSDFNTKLKGFLDKLSVFRLEKLSSFLILELKSIDDMQISFEKKNKAFLENEYLDETYFNEKKAILLDEIKLLLATIQDLILLLREFRHLKLNFDPVLLSISMTLNKAQFIYFLRINNNDLLGLLRYLEKEREGLVSTKNEIENYSLNTYPRRSIQLTNEKSTISLASSQMLSCSESKLNQSINLFFEPLACLARNFSEGLAYIKGPIRNKIVAKKSSLLEQRFASAMGQIRASLLQLIAGLNAWGTNAIEFKERSLGLSELLNKLKQIKTVYPQEGEAQSRFILLQETIDAAIEDTADQVKKLLNEYLFYNEKLECLIRDFSHASEASTLSLFFPSAAGYKKKESRLLNSYASLTKRFDRLEKLMRVVRYDKNEEIIKLYGLVEDGKSAWNVFYLLKEKNPFLDKSNIHSIEKPSKTCVDQIPCVETDTKDKVIIHEKILSSKKKMRKKTKSSVPRLIKSNKKENKSHAALSLLELFKAWNDSFSDWRVQTDSQLSRLFYVIEQCSLPILSNTASAFLKYLEFYKDLLDKRKLELEAQRANVSPIFAVSSANEAVVGYLLQHEAWLNNQLARFVACSQFIDRCTEQYRHRNREANKINSVTGFPSLKGLPVIQTEAFNHLLASYLRCVVEYNKAKMKLVVEENKLFDLSCTFITTILSIGLLEQMSNETETLLTTFSEQITLIGQLNCHMKQQDESKQQLKAQLELVVPPNVLRFYMSRIDPGEEQRLMNSHNTVYNPSMFFPNTGMLLPVEFHLVNPPMNPFLLGEEVYGFPLSF